VQLPVALRLTRGARFSCKAVGVDTEMAEMAFTAAGFKLQGLFVRIF
jgi:hypothetical protein